MQDGKQVSVRGRNVFLNKFTGQFQTRYTDVYSTDNGWVAMPSFDNETGMTFPSYEAQYKAAKKRGEIAWFETREKAEKYSRAESDRDNAQILRLLGER
jgi:hypothetical protein